MFFYNIKSEQRSPTPTSDCLYPQLFVGGLMSYLCFYVSFLIVVPTISFGVESVLLFFLAFRIPLCFICLFLFVCLFLSLSVFSLIFVLFSLSLSCVLCSQCCQCLPELFILDFPLVFSKVGDNMPPCRGSDQYVLLISSWPTKTKDIDYPLRKNEFDDAYSINQVEWSFVWPIYWLIVWYHHQYSRTITSVMKMEITRKQYMTLWWFCQDLLCVL